MSKSEGSYPSFPGPGQIPELRSNLVRKDTVEANSRERLTLNMEQLIEIIKKYLTEWSKPGESRLSNEGLIEINWESIAYHRNMMEVQGRLPTMKDPTISDEVVDEFVRTNLEEIRQRLSKERVTVEGIGSDRLIISTAESKRVKAENIRKAVDVILAKLVTSSKTDGEVVFELGSHEISIPGDYVEEALKDNVTRSNWRSLKIKRLSDRGYGGYVVYQFTFRE